MVRGGSGERRKMCPTAKRRCGAAKKKGSSGAKLEHDDDASLTFDEIFQRVLAFSDADSLAVVSRTCSALHQTSEDVAKARCLSLVAHFHRLGEVELSQDYATEVRQERVSERASEQQDRERRHTSKSLRCAGEAEPAVSNSWFLPRCPAFI